MEIKYGWRVLLCCCAAGLLLPPAIAGKPETERNLHFQSSPAAASGQRVALVIGNTGYASAPLKNPVNDATAIASRLEKLGFTVIRRENLKVREIGRTLSEFRSRLQPGGEALFFYAGHGLQIKGINYLPAVDADISAEEDAPLQSISLDQVMGILEESKSRLNLVFLDACRNNPFSRRFRAQADGLARVNAPSGTLIAFATRPGSVAADGSGQHGLYTEHLLRQMEQPGLPIEQLLKAVASEVKRQSGGRQEPWQEGSIEGDFYFAPPVAATVQTAAQALTKTAETGNAASSAAQIERDFWTSIRDGNDPAEFEAYLQKYPQGEFRALAEVRLRKLRAPAATRTDPAASAVPASPPPPAQVAAPATQRRTGDMETGKIEAGKRAYDQRDYGTARHLLQPAAEQGHAEAQHLLGNMFREGWGVTKDPAQAMQWFGKAAAQGYPLSQNNLGALYERGVTGTPDFSQAIFWFRKAAEQGLPQAQLNLGRTLTRGESGSRDPVQGVAWVRKAAEQGFMPAQEYLGLLLVRGEGVPHDASQAVSWFRKAAAQQSAFAISALGIAHERGQGALQHGVIAYALFALSAIRDPDEKNPAARQRDRMAGRLTPQQLEQGQRLLQSLRTSSNFLQTLDEASRTIPAPQLAPLLPQQPNASHLAGQRPLPRRPRFPPNCISPDCQPGGDIR